LYPDIPYVVKVNSKSHLLKGEPLSSTLIEPESIVTMIDNGINIAGIGYTVYLGSEHEEIMFAEAGRMIRILLRQGRDDAAVADLERAWSLDPREHEALALLARCHLDAARLEAAERCYSELATGRPHDPAALVGLAELALARGAGDEARRALASARALDPHHPEVVELGRRLGDG
jgi:Flp pilus assembly protein TadD